MNEHRLQSLLDRFPSIHVLVVGDFFLDLYLDLDRALSEMSLETGLEAYQVVNVRSSPGAAGTVTSNLRALDVQVTALGVIGDDGMGYELLGGLRRWSVNTAPLIQTTARRTPTYTKPMMREADGCVHELNRLDIKNRQMLSIEVENEIVAQLKAWIGQVDGVIVADQVQERNCGVITDRVRAALSDLALACPDKVIAADSRARIGEFHHLLIKPNEREAVLSVHPDHQGPVSRAMAEACGRALHAQNGRPVFLTIGEQGMLVLDEQGMTHVPGIRMSGPIDIVGAGDSAMAGIVAALCSGATPTEAALMGNLVASITVQQIGVTGTATRAQVFERHQKTRYEQSRIVDCP